MRQTLLAVIMIALSVLLVTLVLLQQREGGLGSAFGGEGNVFRTKRGLEKSLHYLTIATAILFVGIATLNLLLV